MYPEGVRRITEITRELSRHVWDVERRPISYPEKAMPNVVDIYRDHCLQDFISNLKKQNVVHLRIVGFSEQPRSHDSFENSWRLSYIPTFGKKPLFKTNETGITPKKRWNRSATRMKRRASYGC